MATATVHRLRVTVYNDMFDVYELVGYHFMR